MDPLMGAHQEADCRATTSGSPVTPAHLAVALRDPQRSTAAMNWYAVYTSANHEKRVAEQFAVRGIEHFLPQYESVRKWKDRRVRLQLPLFPGYIFVQIELAKRLPVLQVPGVARLVGFDGQPAPVPEADLLRVREFLRQGFRAEPHRMLQVGRRVRVKDGPLAGMEGIVVRRKNRSRFVISFALIQRAMAVDVEAMDLEPLG
jgi:transcription antitermination factor NusG